MIIVCKGGGTVSGMLSLWLRWDNMKSPGNPEKGLTKNQMKLLQTKLKRLGYEVGEIDGILGSKTRRSVQEIQRTLNQPADAWPTIELLELL